VLTSESTGCFSFRCITVFISSYRYFISCWIHVTTASYRRVMYLLPKHADDIWRYNKQGTECSRNRRQTRRRCGVCVSVWDYWLDSVNGQCARLFDWFWCLFVVQWTAQCCKSTQWGCASVLCLICLNDMLLLSINVNKSNCVDGGWECFTRK